MTRLTERLPARTRAISAAAVSAAGSRAVSLTAGLATLAILTRALPVREFAVIALLNTLLSLLGFADLGLGNGLVSRTSELSTTDRLSTLRGELSAVMLVLCCIALGGSLLLAGLALAGGLASLGRLILDTPVSTAALLTALIEALVAVPLSLAARIYLGLSRLWVANVCSSAGAVLQVIAVVVAVVVHAPLPFVVAAALSSNLFGGLLASLTLWGRPGAELTPKLGAADLKALRPLLRLGGLFFVLAVAGAIAYQTDLLVISRVLGTAQVASYVLALRVFAVAPTVLSFVTTPLWPLYSAAAAQGDYAWIWATFRRSCVAGLALNSAFAVGLILWGDYAWRLLGGGRIAVPRQLVLAFAAWTVINGINGPVAMLLNGLNVVGFQVLAASAMAVGNLALSIVLARRVGVAGPVLGSAIAQVTLSLIPALLYLRRLRRRMLVLTDRDATAPRGGL